MEHLVNSAIATGFAEICTLPICTIKTNYQNQSSLSISETVRQIYRKSGPVGFFNASIPAVGGQIISTSSKFFLYQNLQNTYNPEQNPWIRFLNGATSGILSSFLTHPLDVVRVHWQMGAKVPYNKPYQGYSKTFAKVLVGSSLFFPTYDYLSKDRGWSPVIASPCTAFISTTILQPLDYAKTRQIFGLIHLDKTAEVKIILRTYYKGLFLNYARILPHFTIVMCVIEYLQK